MSVNVVSYMQRYFFLLFCLVVLVFPACLIASSVNSASHPDEGSDEILWSKTRRLEWSDFKLRTGQAGLFKAFTTAGIRYEIDAPDGQVRVRVYAYFIPSESWVHTDHKVARLLRHEQGHFDIAAIYAARLREALSDFSVPAEEFLSQKMDVKAEAIFDALYEELQATQKRYDDETAHGTEYDVQAEWEARIIASLQSAGVL